MADRQITARVDEELHSRCVVEAKARGMSLEAFAGKLLAEGIEELIPAEAFRLTVRPDLVRPPYGTPGDAVLAAPILSVDSQPVCQGSGALVTLTSVPEGILPVWRCTLCGVPVGTHVDNDGNVTAQEHARYQFSADTFLAGG